MRLALLLFLLVATASAQSDAGKFLEQGLKQAMAGLAPVPTKDKTDILDATAALLAKHMTFRPDATASSYHTMSVKRTVEWQKFVVSHITAQAVTEADRLNGIAKRYLVGFGCDAHRGWDTKTNTWGQWYAFGNVTFPAGIIFESKNSAWIVVESTQLKYFTPGPGPSLLQPRPDPKSDGLPTGMSRAKL